MSSLLVYIARFVYSASLPWHCYIAMVYRLKTSLIGPNVFGPPTFIQMKTLKSLTDAKSVIFFYLWIGVSKMIKHLIGVSRMIKQWIGVYRMTKYWIGVSRMIKHWIGVSMMIKHWSEGV